MVTMMLRCETWEGTLARLQTPWNSVRNVLGFVPKSVLLSILMLRFLVRIWVLLEHFSEWPLLCKRSSCIVHKSRIFFARTFLGERTEKMSFCPPPTRRPFAAHSASTAVRVLLSCVSCKYNINSRARSSISRTFSRLISVQAYLRCLSSNCPFVQSFILFPTSRSVKAVLWRAWHSAYLSCSGHPANETEISSIALSKILLIWNTIT